MVKLCTFKVGIGFQKGLGLIRLNLEFTPAFVKDDFEFYFELDDGGKSWKIPMSSQLEARDCQEASPMTKPSNVLSSRDSQTNQKAINRHQLNLSVFYFT